MALIWFGNIFINLKKIFNATLSEITFMDVLLALCCVYAVTLWTVEFVYYFWWIHKSSQSIEAGGECWSLEGIYTKQDIAAPFAFALVPFLVVESGLNLFTIFLAAVLFILILWQEIPKLRLIFIAHWSISKKRRKNIVICYALAAIFVILGVTLA